MIKVHIFVIASLALALVFANAAKAESIEECFSQQVTMLDDGVSSADIIAEVMISSCKHAFEAAVQSRYPDSKADTQKLMVYDAMNSDVFHNGATRVVLMKRNSSGRNMKEGQTSEPFRVARSFNPSAPGFQKIRCNMECLFVNETKDKKVTITTNNSYKVLSVSVEENFNSQSACSAALDSYVASLGIGNLSKVPASRFAGDPIFLGVGILEMYERESGGISFTTGCLQKQGKIVFEAYEFDDAAFRQLFD